MNDGQDGKNEEAKCVDGVSVESSSRKRQRSEKLKTDEGNDNDLLIMEETINNDEYADGEESLMSDGGKLILEQDRFLPIANISRLMKNVIPSTGKVAKDAKECVQECVSEFISFITSEASERCISEKRKTITGEDLLIALNSLGFENYVDPLTTYIKKYREANRSDRNTDSVCSPSTLTQSSEIIDVALAKHCKLKKFNWLKNIDEQRSSQNENSIATNVISLQNVPISAGNECSSQIILSEENNDSAIRMLTNANVQHLQLLMDPQTGQHYINVQTSNGTQQLLPVQTAETIASVEEESDSGRAATTANVNNRTSAAQNRTSSTQLTNTMMPQYNTPTQIDSSNSNTQQSVNSYQQYSIDTSDHFSRKRLHDDSDASIAFTHFH
ncbi:unnamed protein product [Anisakis simplex]|uniref:Nuclear transcription factor Y subunit beta n=1 Tax=Anisakis simplex TaxID=6269 RepID=A0A0M3JSM0_ANISI|nr:unnamed protein product [Anisakis simplex]